MGYTRRRHLGRKRDVKEALLRSLVSGLLEHGSIETSEARGKVLKSFADKVVFSAKADTIARRRLLAKKLGGDPELLKNLFVKARSVKGEGGFVKLIRLGQRRGDGSSRVRVELIEKKEEPRKGNKKKS